MIRVRRETMLGLRNPNSPLAPNPLPRMSRQAGPLSFGKSKPRRISVKRADSECSFLLRTGPKVKILEPAPGWPDQSPALEHHLGLFAVALPGWQEGQSGRSGRATLKKEFQDVNGREPQKN